MWANHSTKNFILILVPGASLEAPSNQRWYRPFLDGVLTEEPTHISYQSGKYHHHRLAYGYGGNMYFLIWCPLFPDDSSWHKTRYSILTESPFCFWTRWKAGWRSPNLISPLPRNLWPTAGKMLRTIFMSSRVLIFRCLRPCSTRKAADEQPHRYELSCTQHSSQRDTYPSFFIPDTQLDVLQGPYTPIQALFHDEV